VGALHQEGLYNPQRPLTLVYSGISDSEKEADKLRETLRSHQKQTNFKACDVPRQCPLVLLVRSRGMNTRKRRRWRGGKWGVFTLGSSCQPICM